MKIEKISDNQIRFFLSETDLTERDIKLSELAYSSEKTQSLFKDMMEEALKEYGFFSENKPLIIEAIPISLDSIMIIVTKVEGEESEAKLNLLSESRDLRKYKKKLSALKSSSVENVTSIYVYSFNAIDDVISVSKRLNDTFNGDSLLFKLNSKFFLYLSSMESDTEQNFDHILAEYGEKYVSSILSKEYMIEHGDIVVPENAVFQLSKW